jgi:Flp pilus assembly protein TadG
MTPRLRPHPRKKGLSGFWRDRRGVSAVEFALIAPVLVIFYCGLAELTQAMMAQRRSATSLRRSATWWPRTPS